MRREKPKAAVDMTSLIDLTFLLLVTFIVTLPALESGVSIKLPQGKTDRLSKKDNKAHVISVDARGHVFFRDKPITLDELESTLRKMVKEDPDVPVLVRGDERIGYGDVMEVVNLLYKCKVRKMALVTEEK
jgi:biopolymer transport protein ExbD